MSSDLIPEDQVFIFGPVYTIYKHTGYSFEPNELEDGHESKRLMGVALDLLGVEELLREARRDLLRVATKIKEHIEAGAETRVLPFYPSGEINSSKIGQIDMLLERRENKIQMLRAQVATLLAYDPALKKTVEGRCDGPIPS